MKNNYNFGCSESTGGETEENDPPAEVTSGSLTVIGEATGNE